MSSKYQILYDRLLFERCSFCLGSGRRIKGMINCPSCRGSGSTYYNINHFIAILLRIYNEE